MWEDHIVKEVREARAAVFSECGEDLEQLFQHLKKRGEETGRNYRSFAPITADSDRTEAS